MEIGQIDVNLSMSPFVYMPGFGVNSDKPLFACLDKLVKAG